MIAYTLLAAPWAKVSHQKETLIMVFYLISDTSDLLKKKDPYQIEIIVQRNKGLEIYKIGESTSNLEGAAL